MYSPKYCKSCGCYIPDSYTSCPACGKTNIGNDYREYIEQHKDDKFSGIDCVYVHGGKGNALLYKYHITRQIDAPHNCQDGSILCEYEGKGVQKLYIYDKENDQWIEMDEQQCDDDNMQGICYERR